MAELNQRKCQNEHQKSKQYQQKNVVFSRGNYGVEMEGLEKFDKKFGRELELSHFLLKGCSN